jgi:hypothetical protein
MDSTANSVWPQPPLSDGEIHFLWSFMDGSIMNPETRWRLRYGWGMCQRHAFGWVSMEATFRPSILMGPVILYEDIMERAVQAFRARGPGQGLRVAWGLRERGPCLMCELDYGPDSKAAAADERALKHGRELQNIRSFALATEPWWQPAVCGVCAGSDSPALCRGHLREALLRGGAVDLERQRTLAESILRHLSSFSRGLTWDYRGTDTVEDRAALVSAIGWCGGWQPWLWLMAGSGSNKDTGGILP